MAEVLRARVEQALALGDQALAEGRATAEQRAGYGRANAIFHAAIEQAAGSRLITDVIRICDRIPQAVARNIVAFDIENVRRRHSDHRRIYEAIICREPQSAETLMREHVASVKTSMIRAFTQQNSTRVPEIGDLNQPHPHRSSTIL
jgi:GntR family transcriptional regulator of vanillate catabolism